VAVRRVDVDPDVVLGHLSEGIEVVVDRSPLDPSPFAPHEVLVVSADPERLAEAGRLGLHRLVAVGGEDPTAAVVELVAFLDRS
jgi:hypothetical protein